MYIIPARTRLNYIHSNADGFLYHGMPLGLKWEDLDGIRVQRSLAHPSNGQWVLEDPKTNRARRTVTITPTVQQTLKEHRRPQVRDRLAAGDKYQDHGLVFAVNNGNPLDWHVIVARYFTEIRKRAGFPQIRPYDLRHTCATLLLAAGENVKVVSERLGHASAALTLDVYSHVLPAMQSDATAKMEALLATERAAI